MAPFKVTLSELLRRGKFESGKPTPVMVTRVPPAREPEEGEMELT